MTAGTGIWDSEKNARSAVNPDADRSLDLIQRARRQGSAGPAQD
jgi:hypothetical protein